MNGSRMLSELRHTKCMPAVQHSSCSRKGPSTGATSAAVHRSWVGTLHVQAMAARSSHDRCRRTCSIAVPETLAW